MNIQILTQAQADQLTALNQSNVICVICDYGHGPCIAEGSIADAAFADHKALLDSFAIPVTTIDYNPELI